KEDATVVFDDAPQLRERRASKLSFVDKTEQALAVGEEFATALSIDERSLPGAYTLVDYDPRRPRLPLVSGEVSERAPDVEHEQYLYAPGLFNAEHDSPLEAPDAGQTPVADNHGAARSQERYGQTVARVMREAADVRRRRFRFETRVSDLRPGTVLEVTGHPRADVSERPMLVERFALRGEVAHEDEWRFEAEGVFGDRPYRPLLVTPKPRIYGLHTAVVVGPGQPEATPKGKEGGAATALDQQAIEQRLVDEEIYVDELGRVRVQFSWDREGSFDSRSSIWMRVAQAWAGAGYGIRATPRVGHEVLVAFLDGDPDAPLIVGSVHNEVEKGAFKLPDNKTVSSWRSCSSPGGEGFNELRFDDAKDREHVYFQAERNMDELIKRDRSTAIGRDASRSVQNRDSLSVGHDRVKTVNHNEVEATGLNRCAVVGLNRVATVGIEDSTHVGTRWSVTIARGLTSQLAQGIEGIFKGPLAAVARSAATTMVGRIPFDPLATAVDTAFTRFGQSATGLMRNVLGTLEGFAGEEGPPPTSIEMVDRQIKLSTGDASITLDGPNIILTAQGSIIMHAMESASLLAEDEVAVAAHNRAALVSATDDVILQAAETLHLNPFDPASTPEPARGMEEPEVVAPSPGSGGTQRGPYEPLPAETRRLANQSPTLRRQLGRLDDWQIVQGPAGGGSYCDRQNDRIVIAKAPAGRQVASLAHEVGHALYRRPPVVSMRGRTREQYVSANVQRHLIDEGQAQLNATTVAGELHKIGQRIPWPGNPAFGRIHNEYARGEISRDEAIAKMAGVVGKSRTSTTRENYVDYYSKPYEDAWDRAH
ncbi:MAG: type VI secretion system tip protein VgrG, partial [Deltaproteobacteria bacterium]|nr:type VI secretion system tip protein VgrG [Deltaproteobacteria bacterium]MBW2536371.1 type VI secretion system tip protein VgrG [Deltaproteobacteria bacterium]